MSQQTESGSTQVQSALAAAGSFILWGVLPLYWKQLQGVSPFELIAHRVVWSLLFLWLVMARQGTLGELRLVVKDGRTFWGSCASGLFLAANWTTYIWGVNNGHIIDCSLGYFLTPLGNVALGCVFLRERLRAGQWVAIALAAVGVGLLLSAVQGFPWIALVLAGTWCLYGILRKRSALGSITGLTVETILLLPCALALLAWRAHTGEGAFGRVGLGQHGLIIGVGVVTAVPLLLFAYGAKRLPLTTIGLLQYLAPSVQFLIGLCVYHEAFDAAKFRAYLLIWCGLVVYSADGLWTQRHRLTTSVRTA